MCVIGFDTSNYTTSIAYFDGSVARNCSKLLPVKEGALGLRQSDAVFHHTQSLPELSGRLFSDIAVNDLRCVGVSTQPRAVEGSYMPCFTVGYSHAALLASIFSVPLFTCSHQQGHIAASLWSAGRMDLMDRPHLAWHLSGGTTELLLVVPEGRNVHCTKIGGTTDISAGQLIDRTGQMLRLPFPSGKYLDKISKSATGKDKFSVKCPETYFSLSGMENKAQQFFDSHNDPAETAAFVLRSIATTVCKATENAWKRYDKLPVVFAGGVSSNSLLRELAEYLNPIFAAPQYSTDNALGVAILAYRHLEE